MVMLCSYWRSIGSLEYFMVLKFLTCHKALGWFELLVVLITRVVLYFPNAVWKHKKKNRKKTHKKYYDW